MQQVNYKLLREAVNSLRISNFGDENVAKFILQTGHPLFSVNQGHHHPLSAAIRQMMFKEVLLDMCRILKKASIELSSYYGAGTREQATVDKVEFELFAKMLAHFGKRAALPTSVRWQAWGDGDYIGDEARRFARGQRLLHPDAELIMDVYHLSPELISRLLDNSPVVYVVCRYFSGAAGTDNDMTNQRSDPVEGCWIRKDGLVTFWPDSCSIAYPPHPDVNWLFAQQHADFEVSHLRAIGPMHLLRIVRSSPDAKPIAPPAFDMCGISSPLVDVVRINRDDMRDGLMRRVFHALSLVRYYSGYSWLAGEVEKPWIEYLVVVPVFRDLSYKYGVKNMTAWTTDTLRDEVHSRVSVSTFAAFHVRRPSFYAEVVENTFWAVLFSVRSSAPRMFRDFRLSTLSAEKALEDARKQKNQPMSLTSTLDWKNVGLTALAGLVVFGVYRYGPSLGPVLAMDLGSVCSFVWNHGVDWFRSMAGLESAIGQSSLQLASTHAAECAEVGSKLVSWSQIFDYQRQWLGSSAMLSAYAFGALGEELVRRFAPGWSVVLTGLEVIVKTLAFGWPMGLLSLGFHAGMFGVQHVLGTIPAIAIHGYWNCTALTAQAIFKDVASRSAAADGGPQVIMSIASLRKGGVLLASAAGLGYLWSSFSRAATDVVADGFRAAYSQGHTYDFEGVVSLRPGEKLPSFSSKFCPVYKSTGKMKVMSENSRVSLDQIMSDDSEQRATDGVYPLLATNGLLWRPAKTPANLVVALKARVHRPTRYVMEQDHQMMNDWFYVWELLAWHMALGCAEYVPLEDILKSLDSGRRARLLAAVDKVASGERDFRVTIDMKNNETLNLKREGGVIYIKPRTIINVGPQAQACSQHAARYFSARLKGINGVVFPVGGVCAHNIRFFYCSGMTQADLSALGQQIFLSPMEGYTILVMGDDMVIVSYIDGVLVIKCTDFTQYDASQDEFCLVEGRTVMYSILGFEQESFVMSSHCDGPYRSKMGPVHVVGTRESAQNTGSADTTPWNSSNTECSTFVCLRSYNSVTPADYARLGLEIKMSLRSHWPGTDFLKGWFVPDSEGLPMWIPLPSMVLKLGKMLRNPLEVYDSMEGYCYALSQNIIVDDDYPILGAFMQSIRRMARVPGGDARPVEQENPYKIMPTMARKVDREAVLGLIHERYQLGATEIECAEQLLLSVTTLPVVVGSQVFVRLRDIDY